MANFLNEIIEGGADFFDTDLNQVLQGGNGVEAAYQEFKNNTQGAGGFSKQASDPALESNPKKATKSYINEYAFISYGGHYINPGYSIGNAFQGTTDGHQPISGLAAGYDDWKNPTAKNIIEWSNTLQGKQSKSPTFDSDVTNKDIEADIDRTASSVVGADEDVDPSDSAKFKRASDNVNTAAVQAGRKATAQSAAGQVAQIGNIDESTRKNLPPSVGLLKYEWKDFAFCKYFGRIPNNRLITLRRFKLPTLDSGAVIGRDELVKKVNHFNKGAQDYLNSDSARALTYFGEETGNNINTFLPFSFHLNWSTQQASLENPGINNGLASGNYNPFQSKDVQSLVFNDLIGSTDTASNRVFKAMGLFLQQQNEDNTGNINEFTSGTGVNDSSNGSSSPYELALKYATSMNPFETGWQHRIYGPINVITRTARRSRGLSFDNKTMTVTFEYDTMQVDTLNPKLAMLDIISNILALTYADASFYGGDFRFIPQPTDFPIPEGLQDAIEKYATGKETNFATLGEAYGGALQKSFTSFTEGLEKYVKGRDSTELSKIIDSATELAQQLNIVKPTEGSEDSNNNKVPKDKTGNDLAPYFDAQNDVKNTFKIIGDLLTSAGNYIGSEEGSNANAINPVKAIVSGVLGKGFSISSIVDKLSVLTPLYTGEPVGEWHLTVGNPMNPIMMIGNLICTNCKLQFNDALGPDDFPTQLKATITLEHARDRDKGDIESMFNLGQGRYYVNVEGEPEPWNHGFSSFDSANDTGTLTPEQKKAQDIDEGDQLYNEVVQTPDTVNTQNNNNDSPSQPDSNNNSNTIDGSILGTMPIDTLFT